MLDYEYYLYLLLHKVAISTIIAVRIRVICAFLLYAVGDHTI